MVICLTVCTERTVLLVPLSTRILLIKKVTSHRSVESMKSLTCISSITKQMSIWLLDADLCVVYDQWLKVY